MPGVECGVIRQWHSLHLLSCLPRICTEDRFEVEMFKLLPRLLLVWNKLNVFPPNRLETRNKYVDIWKPCTVTTRRHAPYLSQFPWNHLTFRAVLVPLPLHSDKCWEPEHLRFNLPFKFHELFLRSKFNFHSNYLKTENFYGRPTCTVHDLWGMFSASNWMAPVSSLSYICTFICHPIQ
jgi:hypothetical protein